MPQTRIQSLFSALCNDDRKALIAYLTAGDPSPDRTPGFVAALERGGVDLIELGVPFSDPIADGPVIQRGSDRALKSGTNVRKVLEIARKIRETSQIPLVLFTYLNPVLRYGLDALALEAGCEVFDRLRLSRVAYRSHRRASFGLGFPGSARHRDARLDEIAARRRIRDFDAGPGRGGREDR